MQFGFGEFFYNLIPGGFFTIVWYLLFLSRAELSAFINNNENLTILIFVIVSSILGFIFQGIWIWYRQETDLDKNLIAKFVRYCRDGRKKNSMFYRYREKSLDMILAKIYNTNSSNHLFTDRSNFLAMFFSDREAIFSNMFVGSLLTVGLTFFKIKCSSFLNLDTKYYLALIIFSLLSLIFYKFFMIYNYKKSDTLLRQSTIKPDK